MLRIRDTRGPAAILDCSRSGNTVMLDGQAAVQRLLHLRVLGRRRFVSVGEVENRREARAPPSRRQKAGAGRAESGDEDPARS